MIVSVVLAVGATGLPQILDPAGPAARDAARLSWMLFAAGAAVYAAVAAVFVYAALRRRASDDPWTLSESAISRRVASLGAGVPAVVVTALLVLVLRTMDRHAESEAADLVVEITGRQWWWDVRYRKPGTTDWLASANEVHIPTGSRVEVRLTSADVIHSFWAPRLQGKTDLIPGRTTVASIEADTAGVYRAQCAEYCGLQHAHMALWIVAHDPDDFAAWWARENSPAASPGTAGHAVFLRECAKCHTVRGTDAAGTMGPDLTHLASRRSLGAGTVPNTVAYLGGWILNAQSLKPGSGMPNVLLNASDFLAVLQYLQTLQ